MKFLAVIAAITAAVPVVIAQSLPLHQKSRWIVDNNGSRVKLRCINWAGHGEANIPEGLHKQPIDFIADFIKQQGFNCVRLTYSTDHALDPHRSVRDSFRDAASAANLPVETMDSIYNRIVEKNPFTANGSRQDVFTAIIKALWDRQIMTILDNHVSKGSWCCNPLDGNGWWDKAWGYNAANSRFFNTDRWLDGLSAMATWALAQPGVVGMSLRNELRAFLLQDLNFHKDWYDFIVQGGKRVHEANPDLLVIVGGTQSSTDLSFIRVKNLDVQWPGKHVWEMHAYSFTVTIGFQGNCQDVKNAYGFYDGYLLEQNKRYTAPLIVSEWGVGQEGGPNDGLSDQDKPYFDCLREYLQGNDAEWAVWALQGSYYVREGKAEYDEYWGLMNNDWTGLRNQKFKDQMGPLFQVTQGP